MESNGSEHEVKSSENSGNVYIFKWISTTIIYDNSFTLQAFCLSVNS